MTNQFETRIIIYAAILAVMFLVAIYLTVVCGGGRKRQIRGFNDANTLNSSGI